MKNITEFINCLAQMEKVSKRIVLFGCVITCVAALSGVVCMYVYVKYRKDYDTGYYWLVECMNMAKGFLAGTVIPVFIFEIFITARGLKPSAE